jgi:DNA-directed RNA polymerase sigma subunit (sigma70/sigma32)
MKNSKKNVFIDRSIESVNLILKEVEKSTVLNPEEEDKLWKQMREGSSIARNRLINCNLRFVLSRVTKYMWSGVPLEDMFQAGTIGLMEAIDRFDASQGVKLINIKDGDAIAAVSVVNKTEEEQPQDQEPVEEQKEQTDNEQI